MGPANLSVELPGPEFELSPVNQPLRIHDMPAAERPRERLVAAGAAALSPAELLAILLRTGMKGASAVEIGQRVVAKFGSLEALARAPL